MTESEAPRSFTPAQAFRWRTALRHLRDARLISDINAIDPAERVRVLKRLTTTVEDLLLLCVELDRSHAEEPTEPER